MSLAGPILPMVSIRRVRLLAERALLQRFNAGVGFADARQPSQLFCRDAGLHRRISSGMLRSIGTHQKASDEVLQLLAQNAIELQQEISRLMMLTDRAKLDAMSREIVEVCLAWEVDQDTRELCNALAGRRLTEIPVETLVDILGAERAMPISLALQPGAMLRAARLLHVNGEGLSAAVALRSQTLRWLLGEDILMPPLDSICKLTATDFDAGVLLPSSIQASVEKLRDVRAAHRLMIGIVGARGGGRRAVAAQAAATLRKRLITVSAQTLLSYERQVRGGVVADVLSAANLFDAILYVSDVDDWQMKEEVAMEPGHQQESHLRMLMAGALAEHRGTIMVSAATTAAFRIIERSCVELVLPSANLEDRVAAWHHCLSRERKVKVSPELVSQAGELASRYVLGPGAIAEITNEVELQARIVGAALSLAMIEAAIAKRLSLRIGSFGSVVARKAKFSELIVPEDVLESLLDMIAMVRQRSKILETWGFGKHLGISRGVSALFSGEPGTGKTMAASVISSALGLELIRIDLSAVVSKYVGETEKNLSRIFDQAQQSHAMLLFDEADSLFGKRTELRSAQDRFANLEVNYILQRMESFDGISILTTNAENAIDPALQRRLNFRIRFPEPEPDERERLWRSLLPPHAELVGEIDFAALGQKFEMTGGYIKNAIVRAAVFAARAGRGLSAHDIWNGAYAEYAEMGKVMPQLSPLTSRL